ncbi:response regulator [Paenibacillus luteus]|uniref:response regulator transcription factor n=1 Tax=Paenibacillus luteus TaxID=2545753 RepID=UPI0011423C14|nr:response regulator [Paenibacillus luteus]
MLKAMLVDDDAPVVEYLRKLIPWESLTIRICAEAYSAEEALELFTATKPDILLTDIGLPDGNGIELARRLRVFNPKLRVIFLTCHEDFQYVKEALRIEADDYIVKDELNPEKIAESLKKAVSRFDDEQDQLERMAYKSDMTRNKNVLIQQFFHELSHGGDPRALLEHGTRLGILWTDDSRYAIGLCHLDRGDLIEVYQSDRTELVRYAAYNIAVELSEHTTVTIFYSKDGRLWCIACSREGDVKADLEKFGTQLREKLLKFLKVESYIITTEEVCILPELGKGIIATKKCFEQDFYVVNADDSQDLWSSKEQEENRLDSLAVKWMEALNLANDSFAYIYLYNLEKAMYLAALAPADAKELLLRWVQEATVRSGRSLAADVQEDIGKSVRLNEAFRIVRWFMKALITSARSFSQDESTMNPDLKAINRFIRENIYRNITSIDIARHLHLNPSYFSRYFKKMTGINVTDHVHLIKMDEAKLLLTEKGESAENIAYMLGYSDRGYFSRVFKKYVTVSLSEYKQRYYSEMESSDEK